MTTVSDNLHVPVPVPVPAMDQILHDQIQSFCWTHAATNRPVVLVSSGGTAADLEERTVRSLENFSTGRRGALSVEQFIERGYAVLHLWRIGSTSPYGRVLSDALGLDQGNCGTTNALERLLEDHHHGSNRTSTSNNHDNEDYEHNDHDDDDHDNDLDNPNHPNNSSSDHSLALHRHIRNDEQVQRAWRQSNVAKSKSLLVTVPFRTVEEYLARLQECAMILRDLDSLGMVYLAAAVSDYYCPIKARHKIQSSTEDDNNNNNLVLTLAPVPKVIGLLRTEWAPKAFVVSFKLETDATLLRNKAQRAVSNYAVHMVVGNVLGTHREVVHVLHRDHQYHDNENDNDDNDDDGQLQDSPQPWTMTDICQKAPLGTSSGITSTTVPPLEADLVEFCVLQHFSYMAHQLQPEHAAQVATNARDRWNSRHTDLQRERFWNTVSDVCLQAGGIALGFGISYVINKAIQKRLGGR